MAQNMSGLVWCSWLIEMQAYPKICE